MKKAAIIVKILHIAVSHYAAQGLHQPYKAVGLQENSSATTQGLATMDS